MFRIYVNFKQLLVFLLYFWTFYTFDTGNFIRQHYGCQIAFFVVLGWLIEWLLWFYTKLIIKPHMFNAKFILFLSMFVNNTSKLELTSIWHPKEN